MLGARVKPQGLFDYSSVDQMVDRLIPARHSAVYAPQSTQQRGCFVCITHYLLCPLEIKRKPSREIFTDNHTIRWTVSILQNLQYIFLVFSKRWSAVIYVSMWTHLHLPSSTNIPAPSGISPSGDWVARTTGVESSPGLEPGYASWIQPEPRFAFFQSLNHAP